MPFFLKAFELLTGYFSNFKKIISISNPVFKILLVVFTFFCFFGCDSVEVRFKNNVKGYNPYELEGDYIFQYPTNKKVETDTISFIRIQKNEFLILENYKDTLYLGYIIRKKGDYYLKQYDNKLKYWAINAFRIKGDSIYNFENAFWGIEDTAFVTNNFKRFTIEKNKDLERYVVDNQKRETLKAFDKLLGEADGIFFKEILTKSDTLYEELHVNNASLQRDNESKSSKEVQELDKTEIKLYPNPVKNQITIEHPFEKPIAVKIINTSGQLIQKSEILSSPFHWNLSQLDRGTYIILLYSNSENLDYSMKITKK